SSQDTGAKVAQYENGNAIIVADGRSYLLSDRSLGAIDRSTGALQWATETDTTLTMILVGSTLFLGGEDRIDAFDTTSGDLVWRGAAQGRVYGLAFADGRLFASTDEGSLHAFREGDAEMIIDPGSTAPGGGPQGRPPKIRTNRIPGLLDRWVFQRDTVTPARGSSFGATSTKRLRNLARSAPASLLGDDDFVSVGEAEALVLNGERNDLSVAEDITLLDMPLQALTAEAWVRVDEPIAWGGIVGAFQDNGSFERGWLLGFRDRQFCMAVKAEGGTDALTYLTGGEPFVDGTWHHVAGTYDATTIRLYVDGALVAESDAQHGPIHMPPSGTYHLGAYRDDNEYGRMTGALAEICVYDTALDAAAIEERAALRRDEFPSEPAVLATTEDDAATLDWGPMMRFETPTTAVVTWGTVEPSPSTIRVEFDDDVRTCGDGRDRLIHEVRITDLRPRRVGTYRLPVRSGQVTRMTRAYECDTYFNYASEPRRGSASTLAARILETTGLQHGLGLVVGDRALAVDLAHGSELGVVLVSDRVDEDREALQRTGIHGARLSVVDRDTLRTHPDGIYNLIVVPHDASIDVARLLRPYGGVAFVEGESPRLEHADEPYRLGTLTIDGTTWTTMRRGAVPDAGSWTHMYGNADNSAFGGESLGGATRTEDLVVTWLGRPGPRYQSDRQNRKPAPLAVNGRLFLQGLNRVIALDAMNGTILWSWELPELQRFNMPRDCSNWCADDEFVYMAMGSRCRVLDASTGEIVRTFDVPTGRTDWTWEWGYLGR
ncbi:MAG: PQQ-binding-like beta-propeller repeat protein, partial [Phycisphaerales bacterium]|nr:PQQ-binding-like beta-propeller repeat protein [Phycisphaerales bacterium]